MSAMGDVAEAKREDGRALYTQNVFLRKTRGMHGFDRSALFDLLAR
jgi:hypothetical protein